MIEGSEKGNHKDEYYVENEDFCIFGKMLVAVDGPLINCLVEDWSSLPIVSWLVSQWSVFGSCLVNAIVVDDWFLAE